MDAAIKSLEFKSSIEKAYPLAKRYCQKMDQLFNSLAKKASEIAEKLANEEINEPENILSAIKNASSAKALSAELRKAFRRPEEFFALRGALVELKQRLGDPQIASAEAVFKTYLLWKLSQAFAEMKNQPPASDTARVPTTKAG